MQTSSCGDWGRRLAFALSVFLVPSLAQAGFEFFWTVDGKPPSTINDLHLTFKISVTPFTFGGVLIDDKGRFATATPTIPGPDGTFSIDFDGASPNYDPTDNVHVAFNFRSDKDVAITGATWTLNHNNVGSLRPSEITVIVRQTPEPATLVLLAAGLVSLMVVARRVRPRIFEQGMAPC